MSWLAKLVISVIPWRLSWVTASNRELQLLKQECIVRKTLMRSFRNSHEHKFYMELISIALTQLTGAHSAHQGLCPETLKQHLKCSSQWTTGKATPQHVFWFFLILYTVRSHLNATSTVSWLPIWLQKDFHKALKAIFSKLICPQGN